MALLKSKASVKNELADITTDELIARAKALAAEAEGAIKLLSPKDIANTKATLATAYATIAIALDQTEVYT